MVPVYLMIPTIKIFGLNEVGVRFPSALLGTLSIVLVFVLAKYFFKDEKVALVSCLLFAIEPWTILFSRTYHEANIAFFFFLLGILLLFRSQKKQSLFAWSLIPLGVSMYTYNANKILVPLVVGYFIYLKKDSIGRFSKRVKLASLLIALFFLIPFSYLALIGQAFARLGPTNIFVLWPKEGPIFQRAFLFVWDIVGRYFSYFSPPNLFLREPSEPATIVAGNSVFYAFEFVPMLVGFYLVVKNAKKYKKLLALIVLAPLPAIVTWNWFQPGRVMVLLLALSLLATLGIVKAIDFLSGLPGTKIKKRLRQTFLYSALVIYCGLSALYVFDSTQVLLPIRDNGNWQPGFRETVPGVMEVFDNYQKVVVDTPHTQPHIFYLFYGKYPPQRYHKELDLDKIGTPRKLYDFGKFEFRKINWENDRQLANTLFVGIEDKLSDQDVLGNNRVNLVKDIWDWRGYKVARLVGTK
jgi:4-amino-4-deoxy-L-arabinose transferase-like glycosyltransferase